MWAVANNVFNVNETRKILNNFNIVFLKQCLQIKCIFGMVLCIVLLDFSIYCVAFTRFMSTRVNTKGREKYRTILIFLETKFQFLLTNRIFIFIPVLFSISVWPHFLFLIILHIFLSANQNNRVCYKCLCSTGHLCYRSVWNYM